MRRRAGRDGPVHRRVYLDQNPFDYLMAAGVTSEVLSKALSRTSWELILSVDNFQEWASCWKSGNQQVGQALLKFVLAIRPRKFLAPAHQLQIREIRALFGQRLPGPFLPQEDVARAEGLYKRFADGAATEADLETMLSHWALKEDSGATAEQLRKRGFGAVNLSGDTLDDFIGANPYGYEITLRTYVEKAVGQRVTGREFALIRRKLAKCPALSAAVRADLFITWRVASGKKMQIDRWDDLRHCINAAYANLFVTKDGELRSTFAEIKPGPPIVGVSEFAAMLGISYSGP